MHSYDNDVRSWFYMEIQYAAEETPFGKYCVSKYTPIGGNGARRARTGVTESIMQAKKENDEKKNRIETTS